MAKSQTLRSFRHSCVRMVISERSSFAAGTPRTQKTLISIVRVLGNTSQGLRNDLITGGTNKLEDDKGSPSDAGRELGFSEGPSSSGH